MTISLRLDERLGKQLAAAARAKGLSKSELIRQCIAQSLNESVQQPTAWDVGKDLFGCFNSGRGNLSERAEELARERIHARHVRKTDR